MAVYAGAGLTGAPSKMQVAAFAYYMAVDIGASLTKGAPS
jgi:hypothetical protein